MHRVDFCTAGRFPFAFSCNGYVSWHLLMQAENHAVILAACSPSLSNGYVTVQTDKRVLASFVCRVSYRSWGSICDISFWWVFARAHGLRGWQLLPPLTNIHGHLEPLDRCASRICGFLFEHPAQDGLFDSSEVC